MARFKKRITQGFTLIELLIVVTIIAILSAIAIPSYRAYVLRSRREEATSTLMRIQTAEEKFYLQNNAYTANLAGAPPAGLGIANTTDNGYYTLVLQLTNGGAGFSVTATPTATAGQSDDAACASFTLDQTGNKTATGTDPTPNQTCWR